MRKYICHWTRQYYRSLDKLTVSSCKVLVVQFKKKNETFYQMTEGAHLNLAAANAGPGPNFINKEDKHCAWPTTTPVATSKIDNWPD